MHKTVEFICECGNRRIARRSRVDRGEIKFCADCARKKAALTRRKNPKEKAIVEAHHTYKCNAKRKGNEFALTKQQTASLFQGNCHYCGEENSMGIDRLNNDEGYTISNSVSCCRICNYAKRDMSEADFIAWVGRVYDHARNKGIL